MRRHKEYRLSRWVLSLSLCFALVPTGHAQIYTADFMAPYETEALGDGLYAFRIGMRRSLFMVGDEGVIATDPLNIEAAKIFRQEIAKITNKPVKYVAYSSSFLNHVVGGKIFKDEGATFVAQEECAANLTETPHRDVVMPDITYTDSHIIKAGEVSLELYYLGLSYGNCLSVMIAQPSTGPISAIREKREFWEAIFSAVRNEMETGTFVEDVPDKLLASAEFKMEFLDRLGPGGYEKDETWILLRRVGSYISSGR